MRDIGEKLKEKREENGLSIEEVANDLKLRPNQIECIENGDKDSFKDVSDIKNIIMEYSRYLGLDGEELVDEFNEYMFDCTSKISVDSIKEAINKEKEIISPYTAKKNNKKFYIFGGFCVLLIISVIIICLMIR